MDRPLVSVHMLVYNQKPYVAQAIESVLQQQTDFPFQLVIGEDCSTDGTRELVAAYGQRHPEIIRVVASDRNVGARANSLRVHAACSGKYIAYCDGDDFWHQARKLQAQVDFLERHPEFGLVHTDADWLVAETGDATSCWHKTHRHVITQGDIYEDLLVDNQIMACTACARKEPLDRFADDPIFGWNEAPIIGDYPRWLFLARISGIGYLDTSTATRRELARSASRSPDVGETLRFFRRMYEIRDYFMRRWPPSAATRTRIRNNFHKGSLKYGYFLRDPRLVRDSYQYLAQAGLLSLTDRLRYLGSKGRVPRAVAQTLLTLKETVWDPRRRWQWA